MPNNQIYERPESEKEVRRFDLDDGLVILTKHPIGGIYYCDIIDNNTDTLVPLARTTIRLGNGKEFESFIDIFSKKKVEDVRKDLGFENVVEDNSEEA